MDTKRLLWVLLMASASTNLGVASAQEASGIANATLSSDPVATPPGSSLPAAPQASSSADAAPSSDGLSDIVVTANRREQKLQDVPIAIAALSGEQALKAGVTSTESLSIAVPGLQFSRQIANGGAPFIRGVGSGNANAGFEAPVATYIDDVYIGSPGAALTSFNNIERVEVLKGPQGTLFGRNATGGVVSIHTLQPSETFRLDGKAGYGNYNTIDGSLYVSGPLTETLSANFAAVGHRQADGYGRDVLTGEDVYKDEFFGLRSALLWKPASGTRVLLTGDYSKSKGDAGLNVTVFPGTLTVGGQTYRGRYTTTNSPADMSRNRGGGGSLRIDQDVGSLKLVSISAYRLNDVFISMDNDSLPAKILGNTSHIRNRTFSQEVQLQGTLDRFNWIVGGFYYHASAGLTPLKFVGSVQAALGGVQEIYATTTTDSYSGFAEGAYEIFDDTKLTLGVRYTSDKLHNDVVVYNAAGTAIAPGPFTQDNTFSKPTYRAIIDHKFTRDIMAYASYSRGFKSGGYNETGPIVTVGGVSQPAPVVAPEVVDAFEAGLKTEWFDHKLRFNISGYYYNYNNMQVSIVELGVSRVLNAAKAHIKGLDMDFEVAPTSRLRVTGGLSILDSRFSSFPGGPQTVPNPAVCGPTPHTSGPVTGGNTICPADLTGNRTPRAPKFTGSLSATYTVPVGTGDIALTGSAYRNSGYAWEPDNRLKQPGYTLLNSSVTWHFGDGKYDLSVWGKNLGNAYYFSFVSASGLRDSGSPAIDRTFGATFGFHF